MERYHFAFRRVASDPLYLSQVPFRCSSIRLTCLRITPLGGLCLAVQVLSFELVHTSCECLI